MSDEITYDTQGASSGSIGPAAKITRRKVSGSPSEGKITATIGAGDNAKNSFIWITIRWSFWIGSLVTAGIYIRAVICPSSAIEASLIDDIKSAWSIFMPIITLALGYAFGKGR